MLMMVNKHRKLFLIEALKAHFCLKCTKTHLADPLGGTFSAPQTRSRNGVTYL